jgi:hypothetical protein
MILLGLGIGLLATTCSQDSAKSPTAPTTPFGVNQAPSITVGYRVLNTCVSSPYNKNCLPYTLSSCIPMPTKACYIGVQVQASDPDEDTLTYVWSGCATGTYIDAICTVSAPGDNVASVIVSDSHGHSVSANIASLGVNTAPHLELSAPFPLPGNTPTMEMSGRIADTEEQLCGGAPFGGGACPLLVSGTISGACKPIYAFNCSCFDGTFLDVYRTASSGECTATFTVQDSWGLQGTTSKTFGYGLSPSPDPSAEFLKLFQDPHGHAPESPIARR